MTTDTEYAWAAGFIEADGCIHLSEHEQRAKVSVIIVQKDRRPLDRLQRIFEDHSTIGVVTRRSGTAKYFRLVFSGQRAECLLRAVLPYLDHKRDAAQLGIQLCEQIRVYGAPGGQGKRLPESERCKRLALITAARALLSGDAERPSDVAPQERVCG